MAGDTATRFTEKQAVFTQFRIEYRTAGMLDISGSETKLAKNNQKCLHFKIVHRFSKVKSLHPISIQPRRTSARH
jgi:hypothetical protein